MLLYLYQIKQTLKRGLVMLTIIKELQETPNIAKFEEVVTEDGKRTTISMNPRYFYFRDCDTRKYRVFVRGDKESNYAIDFDYKMSNGTQKSNNPPVLGVDLCPIKYNSKHNMMQIEYNRVKKLPCASFVDYVSIMEFNDGDVYINVNYTQVGYNEKKETFFTVEDTRYSLKLRGEGKNTALVRNGRLCTSSTSINNFFYILLNGWTGIDQYDNDHDDYKIIQKLLVKHILGEDSNALALSYYEHKNPSFFTALYRIERNPKLKELPWKVEDLTHIYHSSLLRWASKDIKKEVQLARNSINYHLRKGNTKSATNACFYGYKFPKAIRKALLKAKPLQFEKRKYELIHSICNKLGVNNTLDIITNSKNEINVPLIENCGFLELINEGFKYKKRLKLIKDESSSGRWNALNEITDIMRMKKELIEDGYEADFDTKDIREYHDRLASTHRTMTRLKKSSESLAFKKIDTSDQVPSLVVDELTVRSPKNAYELLDVGNQMNHCVASYMSSFYYKKLDIALVVKDNKYVGCLEVVDNHVVQAKLSHNRPVKEDPAIFNAVSQWAKTHGITLSCSDCGTDSVSVNYRIHSSQERVQALQELSGEIIDLTEDGCYSEYDYHREPADDSIPF